MAVILHHTQLPGWYQKGVLSWKIETNSPLSSYDQDYRSAIYDLFYTTLDQTDGTPSEFKQSLRSIKSDLNQIQNESSLYKFLIEKVRKPVADFLSDLDDGEVFSESEDFEVASAASAGVEDAGKGSSINDVPRVLGIKKRQNDVDFLHKINRRKSENDLVSIQHKPNAFPSLKFTGVKQNSKTTPFALFPNDADSALYQIAKDAIKEIPFLLISNGYVDIIQLIMRASKMNLLKYSIKSSLNIDSLGSARFSDLITRLRNPRFCTKLDLRWHNQATDKDLVEIAKKCQELTSIKLQSSRITPSGLMALSMLCPKLKKIECVFTGAQSVDSIDLIMITAAGNRRVKTLSLIGSLNIDLASVDLLTPLSKRLEKLELVGAKVEIPKDFSSFENVGKMRYLLKDWSSNTTKESHPRTSALVVPEDVTDKEFLETLDEKLKKGCSEFVLDNCRLLTQMAVVYLGNSMADAKIDFLSMAGFSQLSKNSGDPLGLDSGLVYQFLDELILSRNPSMVLNLTRSRLQYPFVENLRAKFPEATIVTD